MNSISYWTNFSKEEIDAWVEEKKYAFPSAPGAYLDLIKQKTQELRDNIWCNISFENIEEIKVTEDGIYSFMFQVILDSQIDDQSSIRMLHNNDESYDFNELKPVYSGGGSRLSISGLIKLKSDDSLIVQMFSKMKDLAIMPSDTLFSICKIGHL